MKYLNFLDGLRALAVVLVVLYHAKLEWAGAGYIGVDIFFVISGFLITTILMERNISLAEFYRSRIKRIFPAYVFLFISVSIAGWLILLPEDYIALFKSIRDSVAMLSNFLFMKITTGYFASDSYNYPLLHTWSLSIEWQFYLLWPFVIVSIKKISPTKQPIALLALLMLSIFLSIYLTDRLGEQAYYSTLARISALIAGGLLYFIPLKKNTSLSAYAGLSLILASLFIITDTSAYPGWHSLLPILGTSLIILSLKNNSNTLSQALEIKAVSLIGLSSYSIYLWHWPVVSFMYYLNYDFSAMHIVLAIAVIMTLSAISYRYIETPFRYKKYGVKKFATLFIFLPFIVSLSLYYLSRTHDGWPERIWPEAQIYQAAKITSREQCITDQAAEDIHEPACMIGNPNNAPKALLLGDSHANHYWGFLNVLATDADITIKASSFSECMALIDTFTVRGGKPYDQCMMGNARLYQSLEKGLRFVIIGQRWIGYTTQVKSISNTPSNDGRYGDYLDHTIKTIIDKGATPVLLANTPDNGKDNYRCFFRHIKERRPMHADECGMKLENPFAMNEKLYTKQLFSRMKEKHPQLIILSISDVMCSENGDCVTSIDHIPVFSDTHHITDYASRKFGVKYLRKFGNPFR